MPFVRGIRIRTGNEVNLSGKICSAETANVGARNKANKIEFFIEELDGEILALLPQYGLRKKETRTAATCPAFGFAIPAQNNSRPVVIPQTSG